MNKTLIKMAKLATMCTFEQERLEEIYNKYGLDSVVLETWAAMISAPNEATAMGGLAFILNVGIIAGSNEVLPDYLVALLEN